MSWLCWKIFINIFIFFQAINWAIKEQLRLKWNGKSYLNSKEQSETNFHVASSQGSDSLSNIQILVLTSLLKHKAGGQT
jgi:hypothetical protein